MADAAVSKTAVRKGVRVRIPLSAPRFSASALTLDTYSHVARAMHRDAADQLEKLLRSAMTGPDGLPIRRPLN